MRDGGRLFLAHADHAETPARLLVFVGAIGCAAVLSAGLEGSQAVFVGTVCFLVIPTLVGWPPFKLLSLRPLILPSRPHCGRRHANYHVPREAWPDAVLVRVHCEEPLWLFLSAGTSSIAPPGVSMVSPRWPGFLGFWKPVRR
jgi:hypothetical protein